MGLLDKLNDVELDYTKNVDKDFLEKLNKKYIKFKYVYDNNITLLENISTIETSPKVDSYRYLHTTTDDFITSIKTDVRNLLDTYIKEVLTMFRVEYNLNISISELQHNGKYLKGLYTNKHYDYIGKGVGLNWYDIETLDPNTEYILKEIFGLYDSINLDYFKTESYKNHFKKCLHSENQMGNDYTLSKGGVLSLNNNFLVNPSNHNNVRYNEDNINSFVHLFNNWVSNGLHSDLKNNKLDLESFKDHFELGDYIHSGTKETKYDVLKIDNSLLKSVRFYKNGKFDIKFNNYSLVTEFLAFNNII